MKKVEIECSFCRKMFEKEKKEVDRQNKHGRMHFYCSRSCSGKGNTRSHDNLGRWKGDTSLLESSNLSDEYTPFRTHLRRIKRRYTKDNDVDLKYLKSLWDNQEGKCAITGVDLILENKVSNPNYSASIDRIDSNKGYTKGNIHFISVTTNYAKNKYSLETLREYFEIVLSCTHFGSDDTQNGDDLESTGAGQ